MTKCPLKEIAGEIWRQTRRDIEGSTPDAEEIDYHCSGIDCAWWIRRIDRTAHGGGENSGCAIVLLALDVARVVHK